MQRVNLVTTCADRKRAPVAPQHRLGSLQPTTVDALADQWTATLAGVPPRDCIAAKDLYAGDHWVVANSTPARAPEGVVVDLWIASAGYGLVEAEAPLVPYAATFARGHGDSIASRSVDRSRSTEADWWRALSAWQGPSAERARSLTMLAAAAPKSVLLVVASAAYLQALSNDLELAAGRLASPELLVVVSIGARRRRALADHLVPGDARLRGALGGTMQALNARLARELVASAAEHGFDPAAVHNHVEALVADQPALPQYQRKVMTDDQVLAFVRELKPEVSRTRALRSLRDSGRACEQARFTRLFDEARGG